MAAQIPVKANYTGSDVTSLGEFESSDSITATYLPVGTGSTDVAAGDHTHAYLPLAGGALTGALTTNSTIDGVDIAARDAVLTSTATTASAALPKAGGAMTGAITTNSTFDTRDVATDGTKLDTIATNANNYVHPNHSGEVTSTADGATVIADNIVDEANLKISNNPTNGYVLTAQSGNSGGLTWAADSTTDSTKLPLAGGTLTGAVKGSTQTATLTADATLDFSTYQNFVLTLAPASGITINLDNPSTDVVGQSGFIAFIQDGTGGRLVTASGDYETAAGAGVALTSTASATDLVPYLVVASNRVLLGTPQLAFA